MAKILNPKPLVLELEDLDGKLVTFTSVPVRANVTDGIAQTSVEEATKTPRASIQKQLAFIFGVEPKDFDNFSTLVLMAAVREFTEYIKTPIKTQG